MSAPQSRIRNSGGQVCVAWISSLLSRAVVRSPAILSPPTGATCERLLLQSASFSTGSANDRCEIWIFRATRKVSLALLGRKQPAPPRPHLQPAPSHFAQGTRCAAALPRTAGADGRPQARTLAHSEGVDALNRTADGPRPRATPRRHQPRPFSTIAPFCPRKRAP